MIIQILNFPFGSCTEDMCRIKCKIQGGCLNGYIFTPVASDSIVHEKSADV